MPIFLNYHTPLNLLYLKSVIKYKTFPVTFHNMFNLGNLVSSSLNFIYNNMPYISLEQVSKFKIACSYFQRHKNQCQHMKESF